MAITHELQYSTTAASNTTLGSSITLDGTVMTPSQVDDAFREEMSHRAAAISRHATKAAGSYTPVQTDHNQFWRCTGAVTLNLTAAATLTSGWCLWVRANGGAVTVDPNGAETIDGATTLSIPDGNTALIICTGSTFYTVMGGGEVNALGQSRVANGRLTLTSGTPVTTTDVTGAGTLYYSPYKGNTVWLYDGTSRWKATTFSQISVALSGGTASKPHDLFIYDSSGTLTLDLTAWTDDTTRATALTTQDGIYVKSGATTRRYVGTVYLDGSKQCADAKATRYVWNMDNRVVRAMKTALETTDTWNYTTATIRQANANTANQLNFVRGLDEDAAEAIVLAAAANASAVTASVMIGLDSTSAMAADCIAGYISTASTGAVFPMQATYRGLPGVGKHYLAWLEYSVAIGTTSWRGDAGIPSQMQAGIIGSMLM